MNKSYLLMIAVLIVFNALAYFYGGLAITIVVAAVSVFGLLISYRIDQVEYVAWRDKVNPLEFEERCRRIVEPVMNYIQLKEVERERAFNGGQSVEEKEEDVKFQ